MTLTEIQSDFKSQLEAVATKLQKLQQETQEQQQLFLKLQGAVEALQLYEESQLSRVPDFVDSSTIQTTEYAKKTQTTKK